MGYADLNTIHNPATGNVPPAAWGDQVRDNLEYLVEPPQCSVSGGATTGANGVFYTLDAAVENYDTDGMHTGTADNLVVKTAGRYLLMATVQFSPNGAGHRLAEILINFTGRRTLGLVAAADAAYNTVINGAATASLNVNDAIQVRARQASGGNLDAQLIELVARWIGRG